MGILYQCLKSISQKKKNKKKITELQIGIHQQLEPKYSPVGLFSIGLLSVETNGSGLEKAIKQTVYREKGHVVWFSYTKYPCFEYIYSIEYRLVFSILNDTVYICS